MATESGSGFKNFNGGSLYWKILVLLLLVGAFVLLLLWHPWQPIGTRTIVVTGQAKLTDAPDEFVFSPSYTFKDMDKTMALSELSKKNNDVVSKLEALGVKSNQIKNNSYSGGSIYSGGPVQPLYIVQDNQYNYTLDLTITVDDLSLAQKVEDYLVTTSPDSGDVTPESRFSDAKKQMLENKGRNSAENDAKQKAAQMAKNLGFSLGNVSSVTDGTGFNGIVPMQGRAGINSEAPAAQSLTLQPGENDLEYSVQVTYFIN